MVIIVFNARKYDLIEEIGHYHSSGTQKSSTKFYLHDLKYNFHEEAIKSKFSDSPPVPNERKLKFGRYWS